MIAPTHVCNIPLRVIALDLSTTTGHATIANGIITHGSESFADSKRKYAPIYHPGSRHLRFQRWLREKIAQDAPTHIVVEMAGYFRSLPAQTICVGFRGILLSTCAYYGIPLAEIAPARLKKWATDKGNAKKVMMLAAARAKWPKEKFADDNDADAFLLLQLYLTDLTT